MRGGYKEGEGIVEWVKGVGYGFLQGYIDTNDWVIDGKPCCT